MTPNALIFLLTLIFYCVLGMEKPIDPDNSIQVFSGLRLGLHDREIRIKLALDKIFPDANTVESSRHGENQKKPGLMQRFGSMMAFLPLLIQMLSLPGAIATIKMSLLKSIFVAKLAFLIMLFNLLRNQQPTEVVLVHQAPPQHHEHFYHEEHEADDDKGWFG